MAVLSVNPNSLRHLPRRSSNNCDLQFANTDRLVCLYVYIYVCVYVCVSACMHACMYACMYVYIYSSDMDIQKVYNDNGNNYTFG